MRNTFHGDDFPETLAELIDDCAAIPASLCADRTVPVPREPARWTVNDACLAQVDDLDMYV